MDYTTASNTINNPLANTELQAKNERIAEFVDSSKLPLQQIVRDGLNTLRKENA